MVGRQLTPEGVEEWTWPCRLGEVIDGDTVDLVVDRGFNVRSFQRIRLLGVDTGEIFGVSRESEEFKLGEEQKEFVQEWFDVEDESKFPFTLHTYQQEGKLGRWLGDVSHKGNKLTEAILEEWPSSHY